MTVRQTYKSDPDAQTLRLKVCNNKPGVTSVSKQNIDPIMCMTDTKACVIGL